MLDLKNKVAFVSGAGSVGPGWGNGKATAVLLRVTKTRSKCFRHPYFVTGTSSPLFVTF
jgi:hypothetical protein